MESVITGSLDAPELMLSQTFRLLKSLTSGKIKRIEMRLELVSIRFEPGSGSSLRTVFCKVQKGVRQNER